jgi:hypothetical protein
LLIFEYTNVPSVAEYSRQTRDGPTSEDNGVAKNDRLQSWAWMTTGQELQRLGKT